MQPNIAKEPHGHGAHAANNGHNGHGEHESADGELHPHVAPAGVLLGTFATLMVLTIITVAATYFDFGAMNLVIALVIATIKAGVVALFFMHLFYDRPLNMVVFFSSLAFVGLFLWFSMMDTAENQPEIQRRQAIEVQREYDERRLKAEAKKVPEKAPEKAPAAH